MTARELISALWERAAVTFPEWRTLSQLLASNLDGHGDGPKWLTAIDAMPDVRTDDIDVGATIRIGTSSDLDDSARTALQRCLLALHPWRKGPFSLFGINIDTEWRSDWKWSRVAPHLSELRGRNVLDVGCGNGYYGWRLCEAGARRSRHRSDDRLFDAVSGGGQLSDARAPGVRPRVVADPTRGRPWT